MEKADWDDWWPRWVWVGECFFWYRLTRVVPDKFHRAVKRLCVCEMVIFLERGANNLHMVQLMPLPPIISCFIKIQNGLPFWCQLTQVVLENRPLNGCSAVMVVSMNKKWRHIDVQIHALHSSEYDVVGRFCWVRLRVSLLNTKTV